jgi:hypothetical protein
MAKNEPEMGKDYLTALPTELKALIVSHVAPALGDYPVVTTSHFYSDLKALSLTCHALRDVAQPVLFRAFPTEDAHNY